MESESFDQHPVLAKLRSLVATLPETAEVEAWGHPTFRAGNKIFATFGAHKDAPSVGVKQTLDDQADLLEDPRFFFAPYVGKHGWVGIFVDRVDWPVIEDLVEQSYCLVAPKSLVARL